MIRSLIFTLLIVPLSVLRGQNEPKSYLEFSFGRGVHGTGDTPGFHYGFSYGQEFKRKLYWQLGFEGTLNDSPDFFLFYELTNGERVDASLHTLTAGYQLVTGIKYNFFQSDIHQFGVALLPIFRLSSHIPLAMYIATLFPAITGLPIPVRDIVRFSPGRTFAVGASLRLHYNFHIGNKFHLGLLGALQADTNGDTISHYGLVLDRKF